MPYRRRPTAWIRFGFFLQRFQLGGRKLHVADLRLVPGSRLASRGIGDLQQEFDVNIVMHLGAGPSKINPGHDVSLKEGDPLMPIAPIERLTSQEEANR